ncbi:MAG TPA: AMP-binding protein [Caulobacteraceae bacterium]|nr:AMP-binding protein [Caulobacteraceae bacterium]
MLDLETIRRDRAARIARWRAEGVYGDLTYADYIREGAARFGGTRLVFHSRQRPHDTTVGNMDRDATRLAAAFHALGLSRGDAVAIVLPTWAETTLACLAALKLGLTVVPIVAIYGAREIGFIVRQTRAKALVTPDAWRGHDYLQRVEAACPMPDLVHRIVVGDRASPGAVTWDELLSHGGDHHPHPEGDADNVCLIIYTSGTTADPKGVKHTHNTMLCDLNADRSAGTGVSAVGAQVAGPTLSVFPAGHIAGFLAMLRPFLYGAETVFMDQWIPEDGARLIAQHRITSSTGTPIFLSSLMRAAKETGADISSLRRFGLGAAPVTPENVRWTDKLGFPGARVYGMTEHTAISAGGEGPFEKRAFTDGQITPRNEVRILGEDGRDLPAGEAGEIASRGPRLFMGYVDERLDQASFLPGGWFKTGDIGRLDADGYLTITDRKKDIIIRGGENISAKEIEDLLAGLPGVIESAVTAMPDPEMGERVCAFVIAQPDVTVTLDDVASHFRRLGVTRQKTPEKVVQLDDLPRTASGKVKKAELRDWLRTSSLPAV